MMILIRGAAIGLFLAAGIGFYLLRQTRRERIQNHARTHGGDLWAAE